MTIIIIITLITIIITIIIIDIITIIVPPHKEAIQPLTYGHRSEQQQQSIGMG